MAGANREWSPSRRPEVPKKSVDLNELRKVLQESMKEPAAEFSKKEPPAPKSSDGPQSGALKPGETVNF